MNHHLLRWRVLEINLFFEGHFWSPFWISSMHEGLDIWQPSGPTRPEMGISISSEWIFSCFVCSNPKLLTLFITSKKSDCGISRMVIF